MFDMLLSAWAMQEAVDVGWGFNPTREVVASKESAWVTSNPPYQANATEDMSKQKVKIIQIASILEKNLC